MSVRVTFRPGLTNHGAVRYEASSFRIEEDESISLLDDQAAIIGSICSGVWEDALWIEEDDDASGQ